MKEKGTTFQHSSGLSCNMEEVWRHIYEQLDERVEGHMLDYSMIDIKSSLWLLKSIFGPLKEIGEGSIGRSLL